MGNFNPQLFIQNLVGLGARPNMFRILLSFPAVLGAGGGPASSKFSLVTKAGSIPGSDIGTIRLNYMGREVKYPGDKTFSDWTCQIINDEGFDIHDLFIKWSDALNGFSSNVRNPNILGPNDYAVDVAIQQFSKINDVVPIKEWNLVGAYPSSVGPIELNWDTKDSVEEFSVTFQYQFWADINRSITS
jgi:hypothetical protein